LGNLMTKGEKLWRRSQESLNLNGSLHGFAYGHLHCMFI
jgi:hypothetical protein